MTEKVSTVKIGFFVFIGLSILVVSLILFGGEKHFLTRHYDLRAHFDSIQGLAKGSVVSLSGVDVGNVKQIDFDNEGRLITIMSIDVNYREHITSNSIASLKTQGALGDRYIYIQRGEAGGKILDPDDFIVSEPPTDLLDLITGKVDDVSAFVEAARELQTFLRNINSNGRSSDIASNMVVASRNFGTLMADPNIRASFEHLRSVLKKIDDGQGSLGAIVNDRALYDRLISFLGDSPRNRYLKPLIREAIKQNERQR